jgi:hypothetical protein
MRLKKSLELPKRLGGSLDCAFGEASPHAQFQKMNIRYVTQNKPNINAKRGYATLSNVTSDTA